MVDGVVGFSHVNQSMPCLNDDDDDDERFEHRSYFKSGLSLIVRVNVVLNRTVVVDSD